MNIGNTAPSWRVPTFVNGRLTYMPLQQFRGKRLALCCVSSFTEEGASFLHSQTEFFAELDIALAVLVTGDSLLKALPTKHLVQFHPPLLIDPLRRLGRALTLTRILPIHRCETLFFDHQCRLEFRVIHDLDSRGITMASEMAEIPSGQASFLDSSQSPFDSESPHPGDRRMRYLKTLQG